MKKATIILAIILIGFLGQSCQDDSVDVSKKDLLTGKSWKIISKAISPSFAMGGITIADIRVLESDEVQNYSYQFESDGTVGQYDKANKKISQTNWSFNTDETQLVYNPAIKYNYPIVGDIGLSTMTLVSLSENQMVVTVPYSYESINYVITITFVPK